MLPATARQLLAAEDALDATATEYRCREPIAPGNQKYCAALFRTLDRCRRLFGRFTLRCNVDGATACSTSLAQIRGGRCSALRTSLVPIMVRVAGIMHCMTWAAMSSRYSRMCADTVSLALISKWSDIRRLV